MIILCVILGLSEWKVFAFFIVIRYGYIIFTELMCYNQYYNLCWSLLLSSSVTHELFNYFFLQIVSLLEYIHATLPYFDLFPPIRLNNTSACSANRIVSHLGEYRGGV